MSLLSYKSIPEDYAGSITSGKEPKKKETGMTDERSNEIMRQKVQERALKLADQKVAELVEMIRKTPSLLGESDSGFSNKEEIKSKVHDVMQTIKIVEAEVGKAAAKNYLAAVAVAIGRNENIKPWIKELLPEEIN